MKRLERLASLAFVCVLISLVFHLLGMSFNRWKEVRSKGAEDFSHWFTSIRSRCYQTRIRSPESNVTLTTEFCLPNQWLMSKERAFAEECLQAALDESPQLVCAAQNYNREHCRCE